MNSPDSPFLPHGGYRKLRSYKVAGAVYDATVVFCRRFFAHDRRMSDQMVQAARSGVRNISEGSGAAATSRSRRTLKLPAFSISAMDRWLQPASAATAAWESPRSPRRAASRRAMPFRS